MNSHTDLKRRLAAYSGGDLEPSDRRLVELHLAECPECRAELAELTTALRLVRTTPEIEAPPWLTARVMARVREHKEARRGWLERLFLPLHIKLPLEAMALLMVCVTGWYISQTVEKEFMQPAPQELRDVPLAPAPPRGPAVQEKPSISPPPATRSEPDSAVQPAEQKATRQPMAAPPRGEYEETPAYVKPPPARKTEASTPGSVGRSETLKAAPTAESYNRVREAAPEMKARDSRTLERSYDAASPAPVGRAAGKMSAQALPQAAIRLSMHDPATAQDAVREAVIRCGGSTIDENELQRNRVKARIRTARFDELLQRLERLGRLSDRPAPPAGSQELEVTIQW